MRDSAAKSKVEKKTLDMAALGHMGGGGSNVLRIFQQLISNTDKTMPPGECHLEPKLKFEHVSECIHPSEWTRMGKFQPQFVYHDLGLLA